MQQLVSSYTTQNGSCTTASSTMEVYRRLVPDTCVQPLSTQTAKHALTKIAKGIVKVCKEDVCGYGNLITW